MLNSTSIRCSTTKPSTYLRNDVKRSDKNDVRRSDKNDVRKSDKNGRGKKEK